MRAIDWTKQLLGRHGLERPDGRPLYQYRITDAEFESLTELLKLSSLMGIENISKIFAWDQCFVFYASEWWRRYYKGTWGWDGIFNAIGIDYSELNVNKRNDLIEMGLVRWHRDIRHKDNGDRQLLGTIATEGGLPLHQFSESGGWLAKVLNPVIKKHLSKGLSITTLITSYDDFIPKSYHSDEMIEILTDIVETITQLRQEHQLELKEKPIRWLESNVPTWRDKFPLPIDNDAARSLLGELINTASKEKNEQTNNPFEVERYLVQLETSSPRIAAQIDLPSFVPLESIELDNTEGNIPANFIVEVVDPNGTSWPWCRGVLTGFREKQGFKFSGKVFKLIGTDAIKELNLRFNASGDIFYEMPLINGIALETELPWLFRSIDSKWLLHGMASQTIKDPNALVYIPSRFLCQCCGDYSTLKKGSEFLSGHIYTLTGSVQCTDEDSQFKISSGKEDSVIQYQLSGQRYAHYSHPSEIYIGKPSLMENNLITGFTKKINNNRVLAKLVGVKESWRSLSQIKQGYYEIKLQDSKGNILLRKRVGILDDAFSYKLKPDNQQVKNGSIILNGSYDCRLEASEDLQSNLIKECGNTKIQLQAKETPPPYIDIFLNPQQQRQELILRFPFPSNGSLLFNADGELIPFSTPLYLADLRGYRLKVFDNRFISERKVTLNFLLVDADMDSISLKDIYIELPVRLTNQVTEFVINDWLDPIKALLGVSSSPDSEVRISLLMNGKEQFCLHIRQFANMMEGKYEEGHVKLTPSAYARVSPGELAGIKVHALYLNQPEQADFILVPQTTEGVVMGEWLFEPEKRTPGPWIIYPSSESAINFRPILWNVDNTTSEIMIADTLSKATVILNTELRENAIRRVLRKMASNFDHKSWAYLNSLWKKTSHLPTPTFDIWKIAISEPGFMASLLLHNHDDLVEKLENELPLLWELIPLSDWKQALLIWKSRTAKKLDEEEQDLITNLLFNKIKRIESLSLSMAGIGKILKLELLGENSPELQAIEMILPHQIGVEMQGLLRRKANEKWPELLSRKIITYHQELDHSYNRLLKIPNNFQQSIAFLPAVLVWDMLSDDSFLGASPTAVDIFKIKQLKSFDEDWFNSIFQYLSVWLYQHHKEKEPTYA